MGNCFSYDTDEPPQEDLEARRQRLAEAALKRQEKEEGRGIKDSNALKAKQTKKEEIEKKVNQTNQGDGPLKWNVG